MFTIRDGRTHFYTWDLDRQIVVEDPSIVEVHFCNRTDECSLVVEVKDEDGLRVANVPNVILQKSFDVRVFAYDGKATRYDEVFKVKPRTKPADYVYTETEVKNYETSLKYIDERLDEIVENGIKVDLDGYATEEYVDKAIEAIPEPEKVDLTGYATEEYVVNAIDNIIQETTLILNANNITNDYRAATEEQINFIEAAIADPVCRIHVSLNGDSNLCYADSLGGGMWEIIPYQNAAQMTADRGNYNSFCIAFKKDSSGDWLVKNYTYKVLIASRDYVDYAIANIEIPEGGDIDLSNYYTKEETDELVNNINGCKTYFFDPRTLTFDLGFNNNGARLSDHMAEFAEKVIAGENVALMTYDEVLGRNLPAEFVISGTSIQLRRSLSIADTSGTNAVKQWRLSNNAKFGWYTTTPTEITYSLSTKEYVDGLFEGIATAEGGAY